MVRTYLQKSLGGVRNEDKPKCPECGSKKVEYEHGEFICQKCGLVIE